MCSDQVEALMYVIWWRVPRRGFQNRPHFSLDRAMMSPGEAMQVF
jgi:hypothetical protein